MTNSIEQEAIVADRQLGGHFLSDAELRRFWRDGFIGPFTLYEPDHMLELWGKLRMDLLDRRNAPFPNSRLNYDRHLDVKELNDIISHPKIVHRLQSILGRDLLCWRSEWFPKYPGDGGTEWHQAKTFVEFEEHARLEPTKSPSTLWGLTVWTAFTESTRANGCMKMLPGTHNAWFFDETRSVRFDPAGEHNRDGSDKDSGFFGYNWDKLKLDPNWTPDESEAVYLEMKPGQFFLFSSQCLHGADPNNTKSMRCGWSARYVQTHVKVYPGYDTINALGETLSLERYSTVLVGGKDIYGHNKVRRPLG